MRPTEHEASEAYAVLRHHGVAIAEQAFDFYCKASRIPDELPSSVVNPFSYGSKEAVEAVREIAQRRWRGLLAAYHERIAGIDRGGAP